MTNTEIKVIQSPRITRWDLGISPKDESNSRIKHLIYYKNKIMKTFIITLLLALSLPIVSQSYVLKASYLTISDGYSTSEGYTNVKMYLNGNTERLIIESAERQIIDYDIIRQYVDKDDYTVYECVATDSNYKNIRVEFMFSNTSRIVIVVINYSNLSYAYVCERY